MFEQRVETAKRAADRRLEGVRIDVTDSLRDGAAEFEEAIA